MLDLLRGERGTVPEPEPTIRQALAFLARQAKERTRRKWSQVLGGTCALLMAGFVLFAILDRAGVFLQEISLEVPATVYSAEGVSAGETTVAIDGSVKILGDRSFEGQFAIHEVETTCREGVHANIRWDAMWTDAQDILFYRELGLDLASIRTILDDPAFDRQAALQSHLAELEARRARLDDLILTVQRTINDIKGGTKMTDQEKFEAFKRRTVEANETAFGQEIREKYVTAYRDRIFYAADRIEKIPYLSLVRPKGTFYLFPGVEKTGLDEKAFCKVLLDQAHVLVSPGTPFGVSAAGHFRIACTVGIDRLKAAFDRMEKLSF